MQFNKYISIIVLLFINFSLVTAQQFPEHIFYNDQLKTLETGKNHLNNFYDETTLNEIRLFFTQEDYWQQLHDSYQTENYVLAALHYNGELIDSVGVQFKGNTSYSKVKTEQKLSFAIKLNQFVKGQDIKGYNNLNLNNAMGDPSLMVEVLYAHLSRKNMPAVQANFVKLYINNEYWGVYPNVQQVNDDYLKEWFMTNNGSLWRADAPPTYLTTKSINERPGGGGGAKWGDGTAALNYLGADTSLYQKNYYLKDSDQDNPWDLLVKTCDVLNNTNSSVLLDSVSEYISIDRTLWFLAYETAFSDDDGYVYKGKMDYYVYYEPETGQFVPLEFDGNSAMQTKNVNWDLFYNSEKVNYPLMNKLLAIPELRQRYLAHMKTILEESFNAEYTDSIINNYYNLIKDDVYADDKMLTSNAEFEAKVVELKNFIRNRKAILLSNIEMIEDVINIVETEHIVKAGSMQNPTPNESVQYLCKVVSSENVENVFLHYGTGYMGNFETISLVDDGIKDDGIAGNNIYGTEINGFEASTIVRYYFEAVSSNTANSRTYSPKGAEHDVFVYQVDPAVSENTGLVINEIMASNKSTAYDNFDESDDWIELYNNSNSPISLLGYYFSDNSEKLQKWELPDVTLDANEYMIFWADEDSSQGVNHMNFKLASAGETVYLVNEKGTISDQVFFTGLEKDIAYARYPNGSGDFLLASATVGEANIYTDVVNSVDKPLVKSKLTLYPNPTSGTLNITTESETIGILKVYNSRGQCVLQQEHVHLSSIETNNWPKGLYFVQWLNNTQKLMVK